jgi:ABC-type multidrug transport system ATPase subunit
VVELTISLEERGLHDTGGHGRRHVVTDLEQTSGAPTLEERAEIKTRTQAVLAGLVVSGLGLTVGSGEELLRDVNFAAAPGTLTAIIGPSGAGKSILAGLVGGMLCPSRGTVTFAGHDVHAEFSRLRRRIGLVPQDDVVHPQLTVGQALHYAAAVRLPEATRQDRVAAIDAVLDELELSAHVDVRVDRLSGGQRKRVSVAMELLTQPSLLILDEPTSGLDPALDLRVMMRLRRLATGDRVVVVVTHSVTHLDVFDQVLLLAPGGKTAFCGRPEDIVKVLDTDVWADIFARLITDPDGVHRAFQRRQGASSPVGLSICMPPAPVQSDSLSCRLRQFTTVVCRQHRLILADRGHLASLVVLPVILGMITLAIPGGAGLGVPEPWGLTANEPSEILSLLSIGAIFMGTAVSLRDLIAERIIFLREQAVGLSMSAYLAAKVAVYGVVVSAQTVVMVAIVALGKAGPIRSGVVFGEPWVELVFSLAVSGIVATLFGLAISSAVRSHEQLLPVLVVSIMAQIVFSGGLIAISGRVGLEQLSWLWSARWGFAAAASTTDLPALTRFVSDNDPFWRHQPRWWLFDMAMLVIQALVLLMFIRRQLRPRISVRRPAGHTSNKWNSAAEFSLNTVKSRTDLPPGDRRLRWMSVAVAALVVVVVALAATVLVGGGDSAEKSAMVSARTLGSDVGPPSRFASAHDIGPVAVIVEDPTCAAWASINDTLARREAGKMGDRARSIPASAWTAEQRALYQDAAQAMRSAAAQTVGLAQLTPHRVMHELYEQFIAYANAYAASISAYSPADNNLAGTADSVSSALAAICGAISDGSAAARGPLVAPQASPRQVLPPGNPEDPLRYLSDPNPVCVDWKSTLEQFGARTTAWQQIDPNIPAYAWTPQQAAVNDAAVPVMSSYANKLEELGRRSGNPTLQDFATLAAQYRRALLVAVPTYTAADNHLANAATYVSTAVLGACSAVSV